MIRNGICVHKIWKILNWTCDAESLGSHITPHVDLPEIQILRWGALQLRIWKVLFIWTYLNFWFFDGCLQRRIWKFCSGLVSVASHGPKHELVDSFIISLLLWFPTRSNSKNYSQLFTKKITSNYDGYRSFSPICAFESLFVKKICLNLVYTMSLTWWLTKIILFAW